MPWRFRRSVKILPGVKLNFGKRGTSVTVGGRGFKKTYGHGQTRTTIGLPGTGISYTTVKSHKKPKTSRITTQLYEEPPSVYPQYPGYNQPTQPGQFTQAGWPPQPPPRPPRKSPGQIFREAPPAGKIGIGCVSALAIVIVLACCGSLVGAISGGNQASATPTSDVTTQGAHPTSQPTHKTAATATPKPKPTNTPAPPTATPKPSCPYPAVNDNPWCYTFTNTGKLIYAPDPGFCGVFACISSFSSGTGYVVECSNGEYSKSGGHSGVCSRQGGFARNLYMP